MSFHMLRSNDHPHCPSEKLKWSKDLLWLPAFSKSLLSVLASWQNHLDKEDNSTQKKSQKEGYLLPE